MSNPTVFFHKFPAIDSFVPARPAEFRFFQEHLGNGAYRLWLEPAGSPRSAGSGTGRSSPAATSAAQGTGESRPDTTPPGPAVRWPAPEPSFAARLDHLANLPDTLETILSWDHQGLGVTVAGQAVLEPLPGRGLSVCGSAWALAQAWEPGMRFYGQGEKSGPLERTGLGVKFWNSDVAGEFARNQLLEADTDPMYVTIPWLMIASQGKWIGILLDNPYMSFMYTNKDPRFFVPQTRNNHLILGSTDGAPALYVLTADSPAGLVRKFQRLVGVHERPPLWALGHHQSRWGYDHAGHLEEVAQGMKLHDVPNSGLWLDIGYMDEYRVFTWNPATMPDPKAEFDRLRKVYGERIVPIIDPGVKLEPGYPVYDSGRQAGVYCPTPEGNDYVGYVWPGETVFPDFSRPEVRDWWAGHCRRFMEAGIDGAWIDMNDPSTGWADANLMLFDQGRQPHAWYHNRYAQGMAQATYAGFRQARPDQRVFIISRSAYTGQAPWSAVWLGDNLSNWQHLQAMIPMCLNLSLSGIPFNGPDAPGFNETPSPRLAREWYKAQFLFPFLRNHSCFYSPRQEPWAFGRRTLQTIRHYIRLRYRLLPYLYQCFVEHQQSGDPVVRPLWYEFPETLERSGRINDQFLTGSCLLQAPFVAESARNREVFLPPGLWYSLSEARWQPGGRSVTVRRNFQASPAWVRGGAVIPCQPEGSRLDQPDPWAVDFHVFGMPEEQALLEFSHVFDDGKTMAWQSGGQVVLAGEITLDLKTRTARVELGRKGPGQQLRLSFSFLSPVNRVQVLVDGVETQNLATCKTSSCWTSNKRHTLYRTPEFFLD